MLLALNIGNTNVTFGGYDSAGQRVFASRFYSDSALSSDELVYKLVNMLALYHIQPRDVDAAILASVVPVLTSRMREALEKMTNAPLMEVGPGLKSGVRIRMDNPAQLGGELLCAAVGALQTHKPPLLVMNMDTAATLVAVDAEGSIVGGVILPSPALSLSALVRNTAQLPQIDMELPAKRFLGTNTTDCLHSGIVNGSALMLEPDRAESIIRAVKEASSIPVTVKFRKGWDDSSVNVVEIAKLAEAAGVDAIAVHGRTREQFYTGRADWEIIGAVKRAVNVPVIAKVKAAVKVPVLGNGDIHTAEDAVEMMQRTGCDGVMIGRAAQGNPWIFRQFTHYLETSERLPGPTMQERAAVIMRHLDLLLKYKGNYVGPREMRKHATWYTRGIVHGAVLRDRFNKAVTREDFAEILDEYFR